jgi:membrane protein YqaA with SNARE-associated domain
MKDMQPIPQVLVIMLSALCGATMAYLFARLGRRQDKRQEWYDEVEKRLKALEIQMDRRVLKLEWKMESWDGLAAQHAGEVLKPPPNRRH